MANKRTNFIKIACLSAALLFLFAFHIKVLSLDDIDDFKIEKTSKYDNTIHLSGYVWHSALGIYHISILEEKHSLQVLVYCGFAMIGLDGNLDYNIQIPDSINSVTFGAEKVEIWSRDTVNQ